MLGMSSLVGLSRADGRPNPSITILCTYIVVLHICSSKNAVSWYMDHKNEGEAFPSLFGMNGSKGWPRALTCIDHAMCMLHGSWNLIL
jgi:hypothetical protein